MPGRPAMVLRSRQFRGLGRAAGVVQEPFAFEQDGGSCEGVPRVDGGPCPDCLRAIPGQASTACMTSCPFRQDSRIRLGRSFGRDVTGKANEHVLGSTLGKDRHAFQRHTGRLALHGQPYARYPTKRPTGLGGQRATTPCRHDGGGSVRRGAGCASGIPNATVRLLPVQVPVRPIAAFTSENIFPCLIVELLASCRTRFSRPLRNCRDRTRSIRSWFAFSVKMRPDGVCNRTTATAASGLRATS